MKSLGNLRGQRVVISLAALASLTFLALIGSSGRLVADAYCLCANLEDLGRNPFALAVTLYESWHGEIFGQFVQAVFAWLPVLSLGQGWGVSISLWVFFFGLTFLIREGMLLLVKGAQPFTVSVISLILGFVGTITLTAAPALLTLDIYEFVTQQSFVGQVFLRYPGLVSMAGASLMTLALLLASRRRLDPKSPVAYSLALVSLSMVAGLSTYSFAAFFGFTILALAWSSASGHSGSKRSALFSALAPYAIGLSALALAVAISYFSPGAAIRKNAIFELTKDRSLLDWVRNGLGDAVWAFMTVATFAGIFVFVIGLILGCLLARCGQESVLVNMPKLSTVVVFALALFVTISVPSLLTYSAAWHIVLPRALILASLSLWGVVVGSRYRFSGLSVSAISFGLLLVIMSLIPLLLSLSWASGLPDAWSSGDLPIQPVQSGWGEFIYFSDTEYPLWKSCYERIEHLLGSKAN